MPSSGRYETRVIANQYSSPSFVEKALYYFSVILLVGHGLVCDVNLKSLKSKFCQVGEERLSLNFPES